MLQLALASSAIVALIWLSLSPLNPDWFAYQVLFESGGGWLANQGRDPVFLSLLAISEVLLPGYEEFRAALGIYFAVFTLWIASGRLLPLVPYPTLPLSIALAMTSLAFTRFTIQIREGLALTFVLISLSLIARMKCHARSNWTKQYTISIAWGLLLCATLTHMGTSLYLLATSIGIAIHGTEHKRLQKLKIASAILLLGGALFILALIFGPAQPLLLASIGDRPIEAPDLSFGQIMMWAIYGGVCYWMHYELQRLIALGLYAGRIASILTLLSGPLALVAVCSIYGLFLTQSPTLVIVSFARFLHLLIGVNLVFIAAKSRKFGMLALIATFLIIDQVRSIASAISIYYGIELL